MSTTQAPEKSIALFSEDGQHWLHPTKGPLTWEPNTAVTKIVIGKPPIGNDTSPIEDDIIPANLELADLYPRLTHLHLWQISSLKELPRLPPGLKCLDIRGCENLQATGELPESLDTLLLNGCSQVQTPDRTVFPHLTDLGLDGCGSIREAWLHKVLRQSPSLKYLEARNCTQLDRIPAWAKRLVDVRLDGCTQLSKLPAHWPPQLRRIGLRRAESIARLPDFISSMDYIDLAFTESLRKLPKERGQPRTLFLFGSGIAEPPATEHGETADENVASDTADYFADRELFGDGKAKRCKVLVLGNGSAGKTSLSLAMTGQDPKRAKELGTTHGVQFWGRDIDADTPDYMDEASQKVDLHFWDFGGQEIYHNTHRLFMSKGTVFLVVWDPQQDGKQPPIEDGDYQDEWRRLRYWLDFIHLSCPHNPKIAIVCSYHTEETPELKSRLDDEIPEELKKDCKCFYIDSLHQQGEVEELEEWLQESVGDVVATQGTVVPSYWDIAQHMVERWIQQMNPDSDSYDSSFYESHKQLHPDQFFKELQEEILAVGNSANRTEYKKLYERLPDGTWTTIKAFDLTENRRRRTLSFLSRSGWIYWDANLFEGRVIIGQQWALDGLYAILERREKTGQFIFRELNAADGRFTLSDLGRLAWNDLNFKEEEQKLLLSYMQECGLCFKLRPEEDAWREEDVYVSFEHLPSAKEIQLTQTFDKRRPSMDSATDTISSKQLHKQHWQSFLTHTGNLYGEKAKYAINGLLTKNEDGQLIIIRHLRDEGGVGGDIEIEVSGPDCDERLNSVRELVRTYLPRINEVHHDSRAVEEGIGTAIEYMEVFISYAWDPPESEGETGMPQGYEEPVDAIEEFLSSRSYKVGHGEKRTWVELIRDKKDVKFGDSLRNFMKYGASRRHVIVIHSDKFWKSPNCIFEMHQLWIAVADNKNKSIDTVLIPVDHINSRIDDTESRDSFLEFWDDYSGPVPSRCWANLDELLDIAPSVIRNFSKVVSVSSGLHIRWNKEKEKALAA